MSKEKFQKHSQANEWASRQRLTSQLVRMGYEYLVKSNGINAESIHALCRLTWITKSKENSYLYNTKIPALETIFEVRYQQMSMNDVVTDIQKKSGVQRTVIKKLIENNTGFTNFYNAYRNSSLDWIRANLNKIKRMLEYAYSLKSDNDGAELATLMGSLDAISSPSGDRSTHTEYLLSPLCFCLDPRLRFPIINGADNVTTLLKEFETFNAKLEDKYSVMVSLLGHKGVRDAADLDQLRKFDTKELATSKNQFKLITQKSKGLELKDMKDYEVLKKNLTVKARRIHNELTNKLLKVLSNNIVEGTDPQCKYDALVKKYDADSDLLIEVKSSVDISDVRMAIGQLLDYHRQLKNRDAVYKAVLLPIEPDQNVKELLKYANVGLLWFKGEALIEIW